MFFPSFEDSKFDEIFPHHSEAKKSLISTTSEAAAAEMDSEMPVKPNPDAIKTNDNDNNDMASKPMKNNNIETIFGAKRVALMKEKRQFGGENFMNPRINKLFMNYEAALPNYKKFDYSNFLQSHSLFR
uniref:Uncharacterized protein n=1 Tax=Panagrolaimus superbus TaxID=310955 RepID=A0A914Y687_9BILA